MRPSVRRLLAALAALLASGPAADDESGFVPLFDGRTLDGWKPESTDRFSARDGVIAEDGGTGWLRTVKLYKDFELRAGYRVLNHGGDSGLFFRASEGGTAKAPHWPARAYQLQVIDADSNFMIFGHGSRPTFRRKVDALKAARKGVGEWQEITLKVVGTHAEASLNGRQVTATDTINLPEGYIGLQGENGQFEWRALRIKELPAR
jgi:hypothetical protein